jgi:hypothetical protein
VNSPDAVAGWVILRRRQPAVRMKSRDDNPKPLSSLQ